METQPTSWSGDVGFIGKLGDDIVPKATIWTFLNQKSWVDHTVCDALMAHTAAQITGNMNDYKA